MMGVPIDSYAHMKIDNMSVVKNTSTPESTLKKKSNSIAYHYCRAKAPCDMFRSLYKNTKSNLSDMLMKIQCGIERKRLASKAFFESLLVHREEGMILYAFKSLCPYGGTSYDWF